MTEKKFYHRRPPPRLLPPPLLPDDERLPPELVPYEGRLELPEPELLYEGRLELPELFELPELPEGRTLELLSSVSREGREDEPEEGLEVDPDGRVPDPEDGRLTFPEDGRLTDPFVFDPEFSTGRVTDPTVGRVEELLPGRLPLAVPYTGRPLLSVGRFVFEFGRLVFPDTGRVDGREFTLASPLLGRFGLIGRDPDILELCP